MKKTFWLLSIFFAVIVFFVFFLYFLPPGRINLQSNVKMSLGDILNKKGPFYELYNTKIPVVIRRGFLSADVVYEEPVIGYVKFLDGEFAITLKGHIINLTEKNKGENVLANMKSNEWSEDFSRLFYVLKNKNLLNSIREISLSGNLPAFYDKTGILVIMGYGNYNEKILEYKKTVSLYKNKTTLIREIDLQFDGESVIKWRRQ